MDDVRRGLLRSAYRLRDLLFLGGLALAYALLAKTVLANFSPNGVVSIVWPSSGLALAALLLGGAKYWPGIFVGALVANLDAGSSVTVSTTIATGNTLEALAGFRLLAARMPFSSSLDDPRDYLSLCVAGAIGACISALIGNSSLLLTGFFDWRTLPENLLRWWQGDTFGIILFAPVVLVWRHLPKGWLTGARKFEMLAVFSLTGLFGQAVFLEWLHPYLGKVAFGYWMFLFVAWAAVRFGRHGALLVVGMTTVQALLSSAQGIGFFGRVLSDSGLLNLWFYLVVLTMLGIMMALAVHARDSAKAAATASESRFRLLASSTFEGIAITENGRLVDANDQLVDMLGFSREELIGQAVENLIPDEDRDRVLGNLRSERAANAEHAMIRKDGSRIQIEAHGQSYDHAGRTLRLTALRDITERIKTEKQLQQLNAELGATLHAIPDLLFELDGNGRYLNLWARNEEFLAAQRETLIGRTVQEVLPTDAAITVMSALMDAENHGYSSGQIIRLSLPIGERWFELSTARKAATDHSKGSYIMLSRDITDRKRNEEELRIAATAFESQEGMIVTDPSGTIVRVNRAFSRLTGYSPQEAIGHRPSLLKSGRNDAAFYQRMWQTLVDTGYWQGEMWNRRKDGKIYAEWLTISAVRDALGTVTHYVGTFSEITQNKEAEAEIHRLAYYDPLTRLPNRRLLHDRIGQALAGSNRSGHHGALLFLDLDNFKNLNDSRGHDVGDQLLVETARRIQGNVREGDTVARLGGDEFVVMLEDLSGEAQEAAVQTDQVGEKIRMALAVPYDLGGREFHCPASLGIALFRGQEESIETLLKHADLAMYKAKSAGRNALRFFDPAMQVALDERSALEADLRLALERGQLELHYQPQINSVGQVVGAEALLRWALPERGVVSPADFIPLAEDTGLIVPIGRWVLESACMQLGTWSSLPATRNMSLAVNVSARQFHQPQFVTEVGQILARSGANPARLKIELTESLVLDDIGDTFEKMLALKRIGLSFSIDDFGTGNSSLSYLSRLPLDQLKIDKSFVVKLPENRNDAIIAQTIITMAASLGLDVIAEGVETDEQRAFLERHGCNVYQGYFFSRPLPLREFEQFLTRRILGQSRSAGR